MFAMTVVDVDSGKLDAALAEVDKQYALGEKTNDVAGRTGDLHLTGNLLLEMSKADAAKAEAEAFRKGTETSKNPFQTKQAHELLGMIALEAKDFDGALAELQQSNLQNPYDLYRICQAYQGKGDLGKAKESCTKAATFNSLPLLNLAFIRTKAAK